MRKIVVQMDGNSAVEEENGPWVSLVVLSEKPHQENFPWYEYELRLCVSYQKLNQATCPFAFHIRHWNDMLQGINTEEKYFIAIDMGSGYWKVLADQEAQERLELFTPDGKRIWKLMPMGDLNTSPTFVAMAMKLQMEWDTLAKDSGQKKCCIKINFDYVLLYGRTAKQLLSYFRTVLEALKHHCATLKLKKGQWFQERCEFVGMDAASGGT